MTVPQAMIESWILQLQFNVNVLVSDFDISHDDRSHDFHLLADLTTVLNDWASDLAVRTHWSRSHDEGPLELGWLWVVTVLIGHQDVFLFCASDQRVEVDTFVNFFVGNLFNEGVLLSYQAKDIQRLERRILIEAEESFVGLIFNKTLDKPRFDIIDFWRVEMLNDLN